VRMMINVHFSSVRFAFERFCLIHRLRVHCEDFLIYLRSPLQAASCSRIRLRANQIPCVFWGAFLIRETRCPFFH
jgi:hypothetical protein